jgi:methanogenic corrinoid protein MtbC1
VEVRAVESTLAEAAPDFLELASTGRARAAIDLARELRAAGHTVDRLIVELFSPVMRQVGVRWQASRWTVADEHAVTAVVEDALAAIATDTTPTHIAAPSRGSVLVACAEQEHHALPARMGAERLRSDGWDVRYLGANVPARALQTFAESTRADFVVISCTVTGALLGAARSVAALIELGTPVVAAGAGFGSTSVRADRLGASGWILPRGDPSAALNSDLEPPRPPRAHGAHGMQLQSQGEEIGRACMAEMFHRVPRLRTHSKRRLAGVRADIDNAVHHLATAVEFDEPAVFHDHVAWLSSIRDSRNLPPSTLHAAIDIVGEVVTRAGFPRAGRICADTRTRMEPRSSVGVG